MLEFLKKTVLGSHSSRKLKEYRPILKKVNALQGAYQSYDQEKTQQKTAEFKERLAKGETLDQLLPEAFALVRHAATVTLGQTHFDVQILGGIALHQGNIVEMKTGEGKTLTSTLAIYLNALTGKGVHVVTVNDYLAKRDAEWMGMIYSYLGLSCGLIQHAMSDEDRKEAYACDITYGTNNEFGFDYLRDNMKYSLESCVQRGYHFAIVDEVDSILIDEARTPLIISGASEDSTDKYYIINQNIQGLKRGYRKIEKPPLADIAQFFKVEESKVEGRIAELKDDVVVTAGHYSLDEKTRHIQLTEEGVELMEKRLTSLLKEKSLYDLENVDFLHHVQQALKATYVFKRDVDYLVENDQVKIVDEFTGRVMEGRRFSDGLHQALEAKENVSIQRENQTMATITFQNFFRKYSKLSGMTGTAETEENEFIKIYRLGVVVIPTNLPMARKDYPDFIYKTVAIKNKAIVEQIRKLYEKGQPVLVGTDSIEHSEQLAELLKKAKIPHEVLNAKHHSKEAEIVAAAGQVNRVTISTNMAGRGTDIKLGEGVTERGGLFILGTLRHESRRIDYQLRGRSGRQGDPGESRFYLSLEDDLLRIFGGERIARLMTRLRIDENEAIENALISRAIQNAQKKVEAQNFSIRKHLLEYDDVMNRQREVIYSYRQDILGAKTLETLEFICKDTVDHLCNLYLISRSTEDWDLDSLLLDAKSIFQLDLDKAELAQFFEREKLKDFVSEKAMAALVEKRKSLQEHAEGVERYIALTTLDNTWKEHLNALDHLKESVSLRGFAQKNPLDEYKREAFQLFEKMIRTFHATCVQVYFRTILRTDLEVLQPRVMDLENYQESHPTVEKAPAQEQTEREANAAPKQRPVVKSQQKIGRNDPCPCGSGKKFKNCDCEFAKSFRSFSSEKLAEKN